MSIKTERRSDVRHPLVRPVKLRLADSYRCVSAQTCDISSTGVLVNIQSSIGLVRGQRLLVGIAWTSQQVLLHSNSLVAATVVRCSGLGENQLVAIEFDHQLELARLAA